MPFTPDHAGLFIPLKAIMQDRFSLCVFALSQVLIDIQPLVVIIRDSGHMHGFTHTFLGAVPLAFVTAAGGKPLFNWIFTKWNLLFKTTPGYLFYFPPEITWKMALMSAFIGTFSHVPIDSIMHYDLQPFYPLSLTNPLYGLVSTPALYTICESAAFSGIIAYVLIKIVLSRRSTGSTSNIRRQNAPGHLTKQPWGEEKENGDEMEDR